MYRLKLISEMVKTGWMLIKTMNDSQKKLENELERYKVRVNDLSSLIEVSSIINSTFDLDVLINLVMEKAQTVMHAEASSVLLINEKSEKLECEVALGQVGDQVRKTIQLEKGQGVAGWVWEQQKPLIVKDVTTDTRFYNKIDEKSGFQTKSILAVPLAVNRRIIGVAEVINRTDGKNFSQDDLDLFITFCSQVSLAIDNARMHKMAIEQERWHQQLENAKVIQQSFMPDDLPGDSLGRFNLAAKNLPAISVGGDFFDALLLDDNKLALLIGDVSGKGVPAALYMARLMSDFRFLVSNSIEPEEVVSTLNKILVDRSRNGMFVTLQYAVIDLNNGELSLCNGGHLPIIHHSDCNEMHDFVYVEEGAPLGISKYINFETVRIKLNAGDFVFFYTDGVIEAKNKNNSQFSLNRLLSVSNRNWKHAKQMLDSIFKEVTRFANNVPQHDDMTFLVFHWTGNDSNPEIQMNGNK